MLFKEKLKELKNKEQFRSLITLPQNKGKFVFNKKNYLNFSSNDYLNLTNDRHLKKAAVNAIKKWGCGATGSRLMSGGLPLHTELEKKFAEFFGYESALLFGSGFLTNLGVISALAEKSDEIFFDRLDHASLIDGIRLSGAKWQRFKHNDLTDLEKLLKTSSSQKKFIIVDSLFSMDGDIAPLKKIAKLAKKYKAFLIVDEAHAVGIMGKQGRGLCSKLKIKPDIITGTLSKTFGTYGGFVCCSQEIKEWLINSARTFIFSTALPPAIIGSTLKALELIKTQPDLGQKLLDKANYFYQLLKEAGLTLLPFESQIIPIIIGSNELAIKMADKLWQEGVYVKAIRPPTVPKGTARLRLSITLAHSKNDLKTAAKKIINAARELNIL